MKEYILSIIIAAIICAIAGSLLDESSSAGKILKIITGVFMCVTVLAPISKISFSNISYYFDNVLEDSELHVGEGKIAAQNSISGIIKAQAEAYILDKANSMGLDLSVEVELDDNNYSVPCGITIDGAVSPYIKEIMSDYIEETLGVTREKQRWN